MKPIKIVNAIYDYSVGLIMLALLGIFIFDHWLIIHPIINMCFWLDHHLNQNKIGLLLSLAFLFLVNQQRNKTERLGIAIILSFEIWLLVTFLFNGYEY